MCLIKYCFWSQGAPREEIWKFNSLPGRFPCLSVCTDTADKEQMMGLTTVGLNLGFPSDSLSHQHWGGRVVAGNAEFVDWLHSDLSRRAQKQFGWLGHRLKPEADRLKNLIRSFWFNQIGWTGKYNWLLLSCCLWLSGLLYGRHFS